WTSQDRKRSRLFDARLSSGWPIMPTGRSRRRLVSRGLLVTIDADLATAAGAPGPAGVGAATAAATTTPRHATLAASPAGSSRRAAAATAATAADDRITRGATHAVIGAGSTSTAARAAATGTVATAAAAARPAGLGTIARGHAAAAPATRAAPVRVAAGAACGCPGGRGSRSRSPAPFGRQTGGIGAAAAGAAGTGPAGSTLIVLRLRRTADVVGTATAAGTHNTAAAAAGVAVDVAAVAATAAIGVDVGAETAVAASTAAGAGSIGAAATRCRTTGPDRDRDGVGQIGGIEPDPVAGPAAAATAALPNAGRCSTLTTSALAATTNNVDQDQHGPGGFRPVAVGGVGLAVEQREAGAADAFGIELRGTGGVKIGRAAGRQTVGSVGPQAVDLAAGGGIDVEGTGGVGVGHRDHFAEGRGRRRQQHAIGRGGYRGDLIQLRVEGGGRTLRTASRTNARLLGLGHHLLAGHLGIGGTALNDIEQIGVIDRVGRGQMRQGLVRHAVLSKMHADPHPQGPAFQFRVGHGLATLQAAIVGPDQALGSAVTIGRAKDEQVTF